MTARREREAMRHRGKEREGEKSRHDKNTLRRGGWDGQCLKNSAENAHADRQRTAMQTIQSLQCVCVSKSERVSRLFATLLPKSDVRLLPLQLFSSCNTPHLFYGL